MLVLLGIVGITIVIAILLVGIFNHFVKNKNMINDACGNVVTALKQRPDLIPHLATVIRAYAKHDNGPYQITVKAGNAAVSATQKVILTSRLKPKKL